MVHEPPGRCDDDLRMFGQLLDLLLDFCPAVNYRDADIFVERGKALQFVADLDSELSCRRENEALQVLAFGVNML